MIVEIIGTVFMAVLLVCGQPPTLPSYLSPHFISLCLGDSEPAWSPAEERDSRCGRLVRNNLYLLLFCYNTSWIIFLDNSTATWSPAEYVERIQVRQVKGRGHLAHVNQAPQVNEAIGEFLREMPWRPLSPLEEKSSSSLVRRVMGASLAAVTSTVNK